MKQVPPPRPRDAVLATGVAFALVFATATAVAQDAADAGPPVELENLIVNPKPDPLDEAMGRLWKLWDASAPCLGCDAAPLEPRTNLAVGLLRYVLWPAEPPALDIGQKTQALIRNKDRGPGTEFLEW